MDIVHHLCALADTDVNITDSDGCTPLHRVRGRGRIGGVVIEAWKLSPDGLKEGHNDDVIGNVCGLGFLQLLCRGY